MLSRALNLATVAFVFGCLAAIPASAQNLEAGKSPSQIFSSTCSLCHKSPRGLLKGAAPGSLPGFLRQHYTTSSDMASAMSAYVLSNGAANAAVGGDNLTRQGQEAKSAPKPSATPSEPKPERAARGAKPPAREASKPDVDGLEDIPGVSPEATAPVEEAKPMTPAAKRKAAREAAREAAKQKAAKGKPATSEPPKVEAKHDAPKEEPKTESKTEPAKPEAAKTEAAKGDAAKTDAAKTDAAKTDAPKGEGTRPDPVPAVTPAPKEPEKGPDTAAIAAPAKPVDDNPNRPLTIDVGPAPTPPPAAVPSGPAVAPAGPPIPPISQ